MNDKVSIIIPVYNIEQFLPQCLRTVTSQTYRNIEILLVDDGSSDSSGSICDEWAKRDERIVVIHQENQGVSQARNTAMERSTGQFIGFVDGDDWCEPQMIERLLRSLRKNDADVAMCGYTDYPNGLDHPVRKGLVPGGPRDYESAIPVILQRNGYFTAVWNKMFRADVLRPKGSVIKMDPGLAYGEDEAWLFEVLSGAERIAFVPEALYHWRPREGSATRSDRMTEGQMTLLEAKARALALLPDEHDIQVLARGRVYNDCHILKVTAYCCGDDSSYDVIDDFLTPLKKDWDRSSDIPLIRRGKVVLLNAMMVTRMPKKLVRAVSDKR